MNDIELHHVRKTFPNGHTALADVSLSVAAGEFVCVVGRSGAGKSTLMRCLNGSLAISEGSGDVAGFSLSALGRGQRRRLQRSVGFIYQEFNLVGRLNSLQNVLTGRLGASAPWQPLVMYFSRHDRAIALEALERVNMLHKARQRADSLSGGEKQRVAIARAIAQEPKVLLADEPVANLDPELADGVLRDLKQAAAAGGVTTLLNIHNVAQALQFADRIIGIAQGRVVFDGPPAAFDAAANDAVYRFDRPTEEVPASDPDEDDADPGLNSRALRDVDSALQEAELGSAERAPRRPDAPVGTGTPE